MPRSRPGSSSIPVLNKVDLPGAEPERVSGEIVDLIGVRCPGTCCGSRRRPARASRDVLEAIVARIPAPEGDPEAPPRALIFDSEFDQYRGVIAYLRMFDGEFRKGEPIVAMQAGTEAEIDEIGFFAPAMRPVSGISAGEVGYVISGLKDVSKLRVGDTLTSKRAPGRRGAAGLPRGAADGLLRPVSDRDRPLRGPPRRARAPGAQRRRALLRAGDVAGAGLRLSLRLPRPPAHGHRPRAARARVRPRAALDHPQRQLRGHAHQRRGGRGPLARRDARSRGDRGDRASPTSAPR